jgi:Uma2 family endonuclease
MPPPDLAVEVDITNPSLDKLPIYAALGVSEVWRYDGQRLRIYTLADGMYRTQSTSPAFAGLALEVALPRFIECSFTQSYLGTLRQFRQWVRDTVSG